jgi:tRNA threonylcarbamoyladenosine biosynthesis protein TsaB
VLLLALDTSTRLGSVALRGEGALLGEARRDAEGGHSGWLLGAAEGLLADAGRGVGDLGGIAVCTGPGSFPGLRVGLATAQGLALARATLCSGLSGLDVLAWKVRGSAERLAAVMDAWREEVYVREYDAEARPLGPPRVETPGDLAERVGDECWALFGDGATRHRSRLESACPGAVFPEQNLYLAASLAEMAEAALAAGEGVSPAGLRLLYLRPAALRRPKR